MDLFERCCCWVTRSHNSTPLKRIRADVTLSRHWLESNVDRLALTFGRPVLGVHNKTFVLTHHLFFQAVTLHQQRHPLRPIAMPNPTELQLCHARHSRLL